MQDELNGILPLIRGDIIGATARGLPPPGEDRPTELLADVDSGPPYGLVRIRYRLMRHKHGKSIGWYWTAVHAAKL